MEFEFEFTLGIHCAKCVGKILLFFEKTLDKRPTIWYNTIRPIKTDEIAAMAQLVERVLGKDEVISSTLISSSRHPRGKQFLGTLVLYRAKSPSRAKAANQLEPDEGTLPSGARFDEGTLCFAFRPRLYFFVTFSKKFQKPIDKRACLWYNNSRVSIRKVSSVGRASALQAEGHRFEPYTFHQGKNEARSKNTACAGSNGAGTEKHSGGVF